MAFQNFDQERASGFRTQGKRPDVVLPTRQVLTGREWFGNSDMRTRDT